MLLLLLPPSTVKNCCIYPPLPSFIPLSPLPFITAIFCMIVWRYMTQKRMAAIDVIIVNMLACIKLMKPKYLKTNKWCHINIGGCEFCTQDLSGPWFMLVQNIYCCGVLVISDCKMVSDNQWHWTDKSVTIFWWILSL